MNVDGNVSFELGGSGASWSVDNGEDRMESCRLPGETGAAPGNELTSLGGIVEQFKNLKSSYDPALPPFLNTLKVIDALVWVTG